MAVYSGVWRVLGLWVLGLSAAWPLAVPAAPKVWHGVVFCQARTDVPNRPGYRLRMMDLDLSMPMLQAEETNKEDSGQTVRTVWRTQRSGDRLHLTGESTRGGNPKDRWTYEFEAPFAEDQTLDMAGVMKDAGGKPIRQCSVNLTTLVSDLSKTWSGSAETAPIDYLLSNGQAWHYTSARSPKPYALTERAPQGPEQDFIRKVRAFFDASEARGIAVIDGDQVVFKDTKMPAHRFSRFLSFSMAKSVTALAIGQAQCEGRLQLTARLADLVPELAGTFLGQSTVRDLLTMSSGTWEGFPDTSITTVEEDQQVRNGQLSFLQLLQMPRIHSAARDAKGLPRTPGEVFAYHGTDPLALGVVINRVTGMTYAQYVEKTQLMPAGVADSVIVGQDRFGHGVSDGNVRMRLDDWIRWARWVSEQSRAPGCLGDFVRQAGTPQIRNVSQKVGANYGSYGYFLWTENRLAPGAFFAMGHGGQSIGWNLENRKVMIVFSTSDARMGEFYSLYHTWRQMPSP